MDVSLRKERFVAWIASGLERALEALVLALRALIISISLRGLPREKEGEILSEISGKSKAKEEKGALDEKKVEDCEE